MIKLKDVARLATVSEATASLVMNNRPGVKTETRDRVLDAALSLGYTPNFIARGLAMQKTHSIGLVVTDIENPFFGTFTRYVDEFVLNHGCNLILSVSNDDPELEQRVIYDFIGKRVDGVIIVPTVSEVRDASIFQQLANHKIPFVFSTTYYEGIDCECIMTDLEEGSYRLTKYLIELGHREILFFITSNREVIASKLRIKGHKRALNEAGIELREESFIECRKPDFNCGYSAAQAAVEKKKPDAIITVNDIMALGAKRGVIDLGLRIPEDISVAGYDDVIFSSISEIPLTTIRQDIQEISRETVNILFEKIEGKKPHNRLIKLTPELIVRKSTGVCSRTS